jgi:hypothetical protein
MKRTFVMATLLAMACVIALEGVALAQHEGRGGSAPSAPPQGTGFDRGDFPPPGGPMGAPGDGFGPPGRPPGPPPGMRPPSPEELERAGVSAAQRAKIEDLHDDSMRRMIRVMADLRIAELDLHQVIERDAPAAEAVDAAIERVGELRTALHKAHVTEMLAVRALLTAEQRAKLKKSRAAPERH